MKIFYNFILFLFLSAGKIFSQDNAGEIFRIDSLPAQGILLDKGWKFHAGDNPDWTNPEFDDSQWEEIDPTLELYYLPQIRKEQVGWFRIKLHVDSSLLNKPLAFQVYQSIASEIYLDGKFLQRYGIVSQKENSIKAIQPNNDPVGLQFNKTDQVFAVRFSVQNGLPYFRFVIPHQVFGLRINDVSNAVKYKDSGDHIHSLETFEAGLFLIVALIHLGFFFSFKKQRANLYFSISTFAYGMAHLLTQFMINSHSLSFRTYIAVVEFFMMLTIYSVFLFIAIWQLFIGKRNIWFWLIILYSGLSSFIILYFYEWGWFWGFVAPLLICMLASMLISFKAWKKAYRGVEILLIGLLLYFTSFLIFILMYSNILPSFPIFYDFQWINFFYHFSVICLPVSLSIYLARDFAFTSKELEKKLSEVQQLSAEKHQILVSQNETLERQVGERTEELSKSLAELKATQSQLIQSAKMASLGELTAGIAHEIQNPLNFVNNFSEVNTELIDEAGQEIDKGNIPEAKTILNDIKENEQKINNHGKRAEAIVKGMLQHSRSSSGVKEPTDINALADEYLRLAFHGLRAKDKSFNATMKTDFDETIGKINIIPQDIGRVILNLITNAFYAVTEKKKQTGDKYEPIVSLSTKKISDKVEVRVKDNGNGIPQKVLDKIFQPFFTTKLTGQGTGLGLSLAYDIVKAHGGELKVETKEGEYAEFIIILPI